MSGRRQKRDVPHSRQRLRSVDVTPVQLSQTQMVRSSVVVLMSVLLIGASQGTVGSAGVRKVTCGLRFPSTGFAAAGDDFRRPPVSLLP